MSDVYGTSNPLFDNPLFAPSSHPLSLCCEPLKVAGSTFISISSWNTGLKAIEYTISLQNQEREREREKKREARREKMRTWNTAIVTFTTRT
jgi:hypothetical protein